VGGERGGVGRPGPAAAVLGVCLGRGPGALQAIAAALAGAARVEACEIDPFAGAAIRLNAALNGVAIEVGLDDLVGRDDGAWDVALAGDVFYERPMAERVEPWLRRLAARGTLVLLGDPGRSYLPRDGLERRIAYSVKTSRELEDTDVRNTVVWRLLA
jgi:predicted nicotinamide N-methyase